MRVYVTSIRVAVVKRHKAKAGDGEETLERWLAVSGGAKRGREAGALLWQMV